jgi:tetratricopeptide (TPR) repeat protein
MKMLPLLLFVLLFDFSTSLAVQSVDELQNAIQKTTDRGIQAKLYGQLGDRYVSQDKTEQAAEAFSKALALGRESFSPTERVQMAIYLSWADRLDESAKELKLILTANPKNIGARTHLARVLSWSGDLKEATRQADMVLKDAPEDREALLVKADSLRWQGREWEALPIYQKLLKAGDNFDVRVGLVYSLLATGDRKAAMDQAHSLKPDNNREERELKKLTDAMNQETRPFVDARYNYYRDSDHNRLNRYSLASGFWIGNQNLGLFFRHTDASDKTRDNRAEDLSFKIYSHINDRIGARAGLGFTQLGNGDTANFPTGHFRLDAKLFNGTVGANVTREVLSDTAELIENRIRMTTVGLYSSQPLTDRFSVYGGYAYKDFSDGNHANDLQLATQYAFYLNPRVSLGYRFRFLDFLKQSHSGFFDPNNYIANRVFTSLYLDRPTYYTYLEAFVGHQTFRRNEVRSNDFIKGGSGSIGIKPVSNLAIEVNVEGGNFAAGTAAGFTYFIVGPRLLFRF